MTNGEKRKRIICSISETEALLEKARKRYNDSVSCLKMDIAENEELGNPKSSNRAWVDYCNQDKARIEDLQSHLDDLTAMLKECALA